MSHLTNPYRAILGREYPEPLIALLAFILGIWMWDHYFGQSHGYAPGTEEVALVKIDRDLRLADAMADDPAWLKRLVGVSDPETARQGALNTFRNLAAENPVSPTGQEAYAIIKAVHEELPLHEILAAPPQDQPALVFTPTALGLARHHGTWWHAKLVAAWENTLRPESSWQQTFAHDSEQLRTRAITLRSSVWLIGLVGLFFIPGTLAKLKRGIHAKPRGYGGAWSLPLGLTVFLVATLAWIGFTMTLELGIGSLPGLHPAMMILLDSAARLLPSLIALGLLFRRPSHMVRVLGLNRPFEIKTILGVFSLLIIIDQALHWLLAGEVSADPGGGLNAGEAGLWGLAFVIVSACLLAPLAEELLYRGVLFRACWNRLGLLTSAVLSSSVFAILHFYDGYGLASVAVFGCSSALLYAATGSLGAAITLHLLYNTAIKLPEWCIYHGPLG